MATAKQKEAAKKNIKKAQATWRAMSSRAHAKAQPEGRERAKPGTTGEGEYYHVEVRPKGQFITFRTHDVGKKGGIQRVAGKRSSGSWDDQKWLISKDHAHIEDNKLIPDTKDAREVLETLGSEPAHVRGDRFKAKPRPNVPEKEKPTIAQRRAQQRNIKKAQQARWAT
ncbi:MAG: hypothetical protein AB1489_23965 [Acidobacteriota bacterium]